MSECYVPRHCYEVASDSDGQGASRGERVALAAKPLAEYRDCPAYVLLGNPGSGKTTAFKQEAKEPHCYWVTARDFITFDEAPAEWRNKVLFIDGLDEVRAQRGGTHVPFDAIRNQLHKLGCPRYRLSCRAADWYGASDARSLAVVAPKQGGSIKNEPHSSLPESSAGLGLQTSGQADTPPPAETPSTGGAYYQEPTVLQLADLSEKDVRQILCERYSNNTPTPKAHVVAAPDTPAVVDPDAFMSELQERGLMELAKNPQLLDMLVTAVAGSNNKETTHNTQGATHSNQTKPDAAKGSGDWPKTKSEVFQLACKKMLTERNHEHASANWSMHATPDELMCTAGMLCAVLLLSGKRGFANSQEAASNDYPYLYGMGKDLGVATAEERAKLLSAATDSELFSVTSGRIEYKHRVFAEYLGAWYLVLKLRSIGESLPKRPRHRLQLNPISIGRILAILAGWDGGIVSELRGLYAWLVVLCNSQRDMMLIDRDPLAVIMYGDPGLLVPESQLQTLHKLAEQSILSFNDSIILQSPEYLAPFSNPEMEERIRTVMKSPDRSAKQHMLLGHMLTAMLHGKANWQRIDHLIDCLVNVIYDKDWREGPRRIAIKILLRYKAMPELHGMLGSKLQQILDDTIEGSVCDREDSLLGTLLGSLYPKVVRPQKIFRYFHKPKRPRFIGSYARFWLTDLAEKSGEQEIPILLDELVKQQSSFSASLKNWDYFRMVHDLISKALVKFGNNIDIATLANWLELVMYEHQDWLESAYLMDWLKQRPDIQKRLVTHRMDDWITANDSQRNKPESAAASSKINGLDPYEHMVPLVYGLLAGILPDDFGLWCLEQAKRTKSGPGAECYFRMCMNTMYRQQHNAGMSLDRMVEEASNDARMSKFWEEARVTPLAPKRDRFWQRRAELKQAKRQEQQEYLVWFKGSQGELQQGKASLPMFYDIGRVYFGRLGHFAGKTPKERLSSLFTYPEHATSSVDESAASFGDSQSALVDTNLVDAALSGLRKFIERDDIPSLEQIVATHLNSKEFYHSPAFLAGVSEYCGDNLESIFQLSDEQIQKAVAFHLTSLADTPGWYKTLVQQAPEKVAPTYVYYAKALLKAKRDNIEDVHSLVNNEAYHGLAELVVMPLLAAVPASYSSAHGQAHNLLDYLLKAVILCICSNSPKGNPVTPSSIKPAEFKTLLDRKLRLKSMKAIHITYWLASGFLVFPEEDYFARLSSHVSSSTKQADNLAGFLLRGIKQWLPCTALSVAAISQLIRLLGPLYEPLRLSESLEPIYGNRPDELVAKLISYIAEQPTAEASTTLAKLADEASAAGKREQLTAEASSAVAELQGLEALSKWSVVLDKSLYQQHIRRREAEFRHPSVEQVLQTLANQAPANAADLVALTVDVIDELAKEIQDGPTSNYRDYWTRDENGKEVRRAENECRNAFLPRLNDKLDRFGVAAAPETQYADDNRADFTVAYGGASGHRIPVEVKCNDSRDLWRAVHQQLIPKYTRDPGAGGYGVYLVFWFGAQFTKMHPEGGAKIQSAEELRKKLLELLKTDEERREISVYVVDCAKPGAGA